MFGLVTRRTMERRIREIKDSFTFALQAVAGLSPDDVRERVEGSVSLLEQAADALGTEINQVLERLNSLESEQDQVLSAAAKLEAIARELPKSSPEAEALKKVIEEHSV